MRHLLNLYFSACFPSGSCPDGFILLHSHLKKGGGEAPSQPVFLDLLSFRRDQCPSLCCIFRSHSKKEGAAMMRHPLLTQNHVVFGFYIGLAEWLASGFQDLFLLVLLYSTAKTGLHSPVLYYHVMKQICTFVSLYEG